MAEGFLKSFDANMHVRSAGTNPSGQVHPKAVQVMKENGIDISAGIPENVDQYLNDQWDYVITVCDNAKETCPVFLGKVKHRLHIGFEDPAEATGTEKDQKSTVPDPENQDSLPLQNKRLIQTSICREHVVCGA